ncbi:hypothetical protein CDAR_465151 [Caerostris darwini]|uniref:Uncharacterized protein n=1 Tax=Caerostris darwini TaxID=1538125 RepID=A0AAV4V299_9ARAC|nr:hypothetical protein CDAR_465151 [Caerostris darwini]
MSESKRHRRVLKGVKVCEKCLYKRSILIERESTAEVNPRIRASVAWTIKAGVQNPSHLGLCLSSSARSNLTRCALKNIPLFYSDRLNSIPSSEGARKTDLVLLEGYVL